MTWERLLSGDEIRKRMEISDEAATEAVKLVKPLVRNHETKKLHEIELPDLFKTAFKWSPKFKDAIDMNSLELLGPGTTYHTCAYHGCFKPTISEVLAQVPAEFRGSVDYFEVLFSDETVQIIDRDQFYGHKAVTLFYKKL
jgi:hypothetical protein